MEKLNGLDAAMEAWKGREERMMTALCRKYKTVMEEHEPEQHRQQGCGRSCQQ